jgi:hypothetical protein
MDQGTTVKSKPERSRRRGIHRMRWLEDVEKDLRETKFKRWLQKTVNGEEWASEIKGTGLSLREM